MEDCNLLVADGAVLCCCCPCLILQIIVLVLLKLPHKLVRKSKRLVSKRLWKKKRKEQITWSGMVQHAGEDQRISFQGELTRIVLEGFSVSSYQDCRKTFNEVEKAMEELSQHGKFAFGSFWGREESSSFPPYIGKDELDSVLHYHLIQMVKNL